jgi:hypothetical protein
VFSDNYLLSILDKNIWLDFVPNSVTKRFKVFMVDRTQFRTHNITLMVNTKSYLSMDEIA